MQCQDSFYPAKLLLFGEHTVLKGSSSLAIPLRPYYMQWVERNEDHPEWLETYVHYLTQHCFSFLDIESLKCWIEKCTIQANIPIGYGLGSSGALTAAIYDICAFDKEQTELEELRNKLGVMESFFHGKSSGFDPLVSYCKVPLINRPDGIKRINSADINIDLKCYLLDSGTPRAGSAMIGHFLNKYNNHLSKMEELKDLNNRVIDLILSPGKLDIEDDIRRISQLQLDYMDYMITPSLLELWKTGLQSKKFTIKVCGAGGGGFFLVFSTVDLKQIGSFNLEKIDPQANP